MRKSLNYFQINLFLDFGDIQYFQLSNKKNYLFYKELNIFSMF